MALDFGQQIVGQQSATQTLMLTNTDVASLTIDAITIAGSAAGAFADAETCTSMPLQPGSACAIDVSFLPVATGSATASLSIDDSAADSPQSVALTGTGVDPATATSTSMPADTSTDTPVPTDSPTDTPSDSPTPTDIPTATPTPTAISTETPSPTDTPTAAPTPTDTPAPADTLVPTNTPASTGTATGTAPVPPTSTSPPVVANTPIPPTSTRAATSTPSVTALPSNSPTPPAASTSTSLPTSTPSARPTSTATPTETSANTSLAPTVTSVQDVETNPPLTSTQAAPTTPPAPTGTPAPFPTPRATRAAASAPASPRQAVIAHPYPAGSLLAGVGGGKIKLYDAVGRVIDVLDTRSRSTEEKGMCFDRAGNLYVSNFDADSMSKFDSRGRLIAYPWGIRFKTSPSSCVADRAGHIYVGEAAGSKRLLKFDAAGHLLAAFRPALQNVGIDSMDLAADQCTLYYTSQGSSIKRFDVCTHKQLPDFATGVAAQCYGLRLRPGGEVLVACLSAVYRLNAHGKKIATYAAAHLGERNRCRATARNQCDVWTTALVALALDRDGRSFWTATLESGHLYRIDLASGRTLAAFTAAPYQLLANVAMVGEPDAALTGASGSRLCPAPASALTVRSQVTPKDLVTGGTLAFVVQTAPRASINAVVQVAVVKTVTDALKRRTQVIQTMVLHPTASGLVADAHGRLAGHIRLSYATARPLQARLVVTVHLGCATRAQSTAIRLLPRNKPGTPIAATS